MSVLASRRNVSFRLQVHGGVPFLVSLVRSGGTIMQLLIRIVLGCLLLFSLSCQKASDEQEKQPGEKGRKTVALFNGENLDNWEHLLVDENAKKEDVWSVQDNLLACKGEPLGYIYTKEKYKNFKLVVEWRWAPGKEPGNNGVLLRITENKPKGIPKCIEAQLKSGDAGNIYGFHGTKISGPEDRLGGRSDDTGKVGEMTSLAKIEANENKPGEWNKYELTVDGPTITVVLNGKEVNKATDCDTSAGAIGLQSEGGEIHFRTVELTPLD